MKTLTRDDILAVKDVAEELVPVPEWGGTVRVRAMTAGARDAFEYEAVLAMKENRTLTSVRARLIARCTVDEDGNLLFSEDDIAALDRKSAAAMDRLYEAITRMNAMRASDIEALGKNFEAALGGDSSSA